MKNRVKLMKTSERRKSTERKMKEKKEGGREEVQKRQ